ncbi:FecCD family ABC transporter permease [Rhizobium rhizogenes]|uniref:FecCD family ABC transporter permease n=1 Tax=Rhizobium rhizogenes TaxID=359 RepID=UPI00115EC226|nr:iron ABC transporter permease [Rhizobium rhizogenes]NTF65180.1 iron ABC transporter permease [Rhizobium rhizogenes]NTG04183.1 iron ABC transporter permease [Rhizobium rhizogenes]NTG11285.1 iron ABC transporter permease [Rhizobium rhizogenes]NTG96528.1 iron ABC transporter permease [Rhizobium rhizogenes]QRM41176.1 iron ABC transporter permease [Rhizobium rhizogenes]
MSAIPVSASSTPRRARPMRSLLALMALAAIILVLASIHAGIGARPVAPATLLNAVFAFDSHNFEHQILVKLRLARLAAALLVGAALGIAGLLLQSLLRNPLGEPHVLGLNAGASLAVVLTSSLPFLAGGLARPLVAALGAALLFAAVLALSSAGRAGMTMLKVTFCGIALSALASSLTSAILILDEETLQEMRLWLAGDLAGIGYELIGAALAPILMGMLLAFLIAPRLNALALGDAAAAGLGVPVKSTRLIGLAATALLCGASVSVAGPIGFIGLMVPNAARQLSGGDLRFALPLAALSGAALLLAADIAARMLMSPHELATGIMTAIIGAPVFIFAASRYFR